MADGIFRWGTYLRKRTLRHVSGYLHGTLCREPGRLVVVHRICKLDVPGRIGIRIRNYTPGPPAVHSTLCPSKLGCLCHRLSMGVNHVPNPRGAAPRQHSSQPMDDRWQALPGRTVSDVSRRWAVTHRDLPGSHGSRTQQRIGTKTTLAGPGHPIASIPLKDQSGELLPFSFECSTTMGLCPTHVHHPDRPMP